VYSKTHTSVPWVRGSGSATVLSSTRSIALLSWGRNEPLLFSTHFLFFSFWCGRGLRRCLRWRRWLHHLTLRFEAIQICLSCIPADGDSYNKTKFCRCRIRSSPSRSGRSANSSETRSSWASLLSQRIEVWLSRLTSAHTSRRGVSSTCTESLPACSVTPFDDSRAAALTPYPSTGYTTARLSKCKPGGRYSV